MPEIPSTVILEEPELFLLGLKWNLRDKAFSCVMVKTNSNYAVKVAERINRSLPIYLMNHFAETSLIFDMSFIKYLLFRRTYFVNVWKINDADKLLFQ